MSALIEQIRRLRPCSEAVAWLGDRDLATAWSECERGDWLLWLAAEAGVERRVVVESACDCAETTLRHVPAGEERPRVAIETARAWCRGEATLERVRDADADADDACSAAYYTYSAAHAAYSAASASYVASAAYAAAHADAAAYAADAAAYAAASAASATDATDATRLDSLRRSADLVRARISDADVAAALAGGER